VNVVINKQILQTQILGVIFILLSNRIKMLVLSTVGAASLFVGGVAQASAATVTAQSGDTVAKLANANGVSISAFEQANGINTSTHLIYAGQTYTLPGSTQTTTTTTAVAQPAATQTTTQTTQPAATQSTTTQVLSPSMKLSEGVELIAT